MDPCLTPEQIQRLVACTASALEYARAQSHLMECDACRSAYQAARTTLQSPDKQKEGPAAGKVGPGIPGFTLIKLIDSGGQGMVYQAMQHDSRRIVAVKLMSHQAHSSPAQRKRFEHEIQFAGQLEHPNIVRIYHSGTADDGRMFFAMEFVDGLPLNEWLERPDLKISHKLVVFSKICAGVTYAHQKGIIHRDLKPGNVCVDHFNEPHILDFGLAKSSPATQSVDTPQTWPSHPLGTLPYMSPEHVRNPRDLDIRADIYSLGVMLYEMLTGAFPYPVLGNVAEALKHIVETEPARPSSHGCKLNHDIETIIMTALAKDPRRRYQSVHALDSDLGHYMRGEPIEAKRDSVLYLVRKRLERYRWHVAGATVVILALLSTGTAMWSAANARQLSGRLNAKKLLNEARMISLNDVAAAKQLLVRAATLDPALRADAELEIALLAQRNGDLAQAQSLLIKHTQDHPSRPEAHVLLAQMCPDDTKFANFHRAEARRLGMDGTRQDLYQIKLMNDHDPAAISAVTTALTYRPVNMDYVIERARRCFELGQGANMLEDAEALCQNAPSSPAAFGLLGCAYMLLDDPTKARDAYSEAIRLEPASWTWRYNRAWAHLLCNQADSCEQDCADALTGNSKHAGTRLLQLGLACRARDLSRAEQLCDAVTQLEPHVQDAYKTIQTIVDVLEKVEAPEPYWDILVQLNVWLTAHAAGEARVRVMLSTSRLLSDLRRPADALAVAHEALLLHRNSQSMHDSMLLSNVLTTLAAAHVEVGDYPAVLAILTQDGAAANGNPYADALGGLAAYCTGNVDRAVEQWEHAAGPAHVRILDAHVDLWLWEIHSLRGDTMLAENALSCAECSLALLRSSVDSRHCANIQRYEAMIPMLRGEVDFATVRTTSDSPTARCEAAYYAGARALTCDQPELARQLFVECLLVGPPACWEKALAQYHLARLGLPADAVRELPLPNAN